MRVASGRFDASKEHGSRLRVSHDPTRQGVHEGFIERRPIGRSETSSAISERDTISTATDVPPRQAGGSDARG